MKLEPAGLRGRIAAALTLLPVVAAALVALAFWLGEEWLERDSLRQFVRDEARAATAEQGAYLAHYEALKRRRALWLTALLLAGTGGVGLTAWWLAGRLTHRSLRPLRELVAQIEDIDLERRNYRLQLQGGDPELQVIVAALNAHMAELDALVERERAFAAAASHELRTPLSVIGGAAAVLAETAQAPPAVLARIERAVAQARQDLEALLALSRGRERAPATVQRLDQLLPQIAAVPLDADAGRTTVHWDVPAPVERAVAVGPLSIVFGNLLRNALRAANGGEVRIAIEADRIRITDDGPGLPPSMMLGDALSGAAPRRDGGSGMGLYIAQTLARREGWTVTLKPAPARGACAELHLGTPV
jgi:signal transduction histidine kinase